MTGRRLSMNGESPCPIAAGWRRLQRKPSRFGRGNYIEALFGAVKQLDADAAGMVVSRLRTEKSGLISGGVGVFFVGLKRRAKNAQRHRRQLSVNG
jgi:hypothetical protein